MEKRICQNCKKDFTIQTDDFSFYEKIKVPPPTWCPECRQQRRYAWRNERTLYRRDCDLCGESTVTIYSPNKNLKVYCLKCWWSDDWDPSIYGRDFDFSRPFFEQYKELQIEVPRMALLNKNTINSEYSNHSANNKNVYLSFTNFETENLFYCTYIMFSKNCIDCSYIYDKGESLYECIESKKIYGSQYCLLVKDSLDCFYCYDCRNCSDCFMSSNLRNEKYVFKNERLNKEKYFEKLKEYNFSSYKIRQELYKEFINLLQKTAIHNSIIGENNMNSIGNSIYNCKNSKYCFDVSGFEDSKYCFASDLSKDIMDVYHIGFGSELIYDSHACKGMYNSFFCHLCYDNKELEYCDTCHNSSNLFGCISIKKGEYMILNKKYTKDEYEILKEKIINHMKKTGEYGEFFPAYISPICYNESQGYYYMPLSKEEVLNKGWLWEDRIPGIFKKETVILSDIPDNIEEVDDSFTKEILKCIDCQKNYNITLDELNFYRKEKIPIPRECPDCRYKRRFSLRLPRNLWHRTCMKKGCKNEFETPYSPNRPEIVYCQDCYKNEIY